VNQKPPKLRSRNRVIRLSTSANNAITRALSRARRRETGGMLFGQIVTSSELRIVETTVAGTGTDASFTRDAATSLRHLQRYLKSHNEDFRHHNYAGEWHSHPSFPLEPSSRDTESIIGLFEELPQSRFLVLLLAKLHRRQPQFRAYLWTRSSSGPTEIPVAVDAATTDELSSTRRARSRR
jgi:[CysO sulfur-carrier protein]-S-L-cysteine hydrolase